MTEWRREEIVEEESWSEEQVEEGKLEEETS